MGTGGTICGTGKFLKEKNPKIKVWGIDTYGSVFKKYKETGIFDKHEIYPYVTEGIGEDFLPQERGLQHDRPLREGDGPGCRHLHSRDRQAGGDLGRQFGRLGDRGSIAAEGPTSRRARWWSSSSTITARATSARCSTPTGCASWATRTWQDRPHATWSRTRKSTDIVGVEVTDTVDQAVLRMSENDFSQIPVTQEQRIVGSLERVACLLVHGQGSDSAQAAGQERSCSRRFASSTSTRRCSCSPP